MELDARAQRNCKIIKLKTSPTPIIVQETSSIMKALELIRLETKVLDDKKGRRKLARGEFGDCPILETLNLFTHILSPLSTTMCDPVMIAMLPSGRTR